MCYKLWIKCFRADRVEVVKTYQYEDKEDVFEREPYGVLMKSLFHTGKIKLTKRRKKTCF